MALRTVIAFDNELFTFISGDPRYEVGDGLLNNSDTQNGAIFEFQGGVAPETVVIDDTLNTNVFDDDEEQDHVVVDGGSLVANGTEVESESLHIFEELDSDGNPTGNFVNVWVFSQNGDFRDIWGMAFDVPLKPGVQYIKVGGSNNGDSDYSDFVPCFVAGTPILTPNGWRDAEALHVGDLVWTKENASAIIRWAGKTETSGSGKMAPIRIRAGVFGDHGEIFVSPQHRILVEDYRLGLLTGHEAALVPAKHLVGVEGVEMAPRDLVTYVHFMLDRHAVVNSNGLLSESFYPGDVAISGLDGETRKEVFALFPKLRVGAVAYGGIAAPCLGSAEAKALRNALL